MYAPLEQMKITTALRQWVNPENHGGKSEYKHRCKSYTADCQKFCM